MLMGGWWDAGGSWGREEQARGCGGRNWGPKRGIGVRSVGP